MGHYASEMGIGPTNDDRKLARKYAERAWIEIGNDNGYLDKGPIARIKKAILDAIYEHDKHKNIDR